MIKLVNWWLVEVSYSFKKWELSPWEMKKIFARSKI